MRILCLLFNKALRCLVKCPRNFSGYGSDNYAALTRDQSYASDINLSNLLPQIMRPTTNSGQGYSYTVLKFTQPLGPPPAPVSITEQDLSDADADGSSEDEQSRAAAKEGGAYCIICDKFISRRGDMPRHRRTHLPVKDKFKLMHRCPFPGCRFKNLQKSNVDTHIRTHTGSKTQKCPSCSFKTVDPGSLTRHRKRLHGYVPKGRNSKGRETETDKTPTPPPPSQYASSSSSALPPPHTYTYTPEPLPPIVPPRRGDRCPDEAVRLRQHGIGQYALREYQPPNYHDQRYAEDSGDDYEEEPFTSSRVLPLPISLTRTTSVDPLVGEQRPVRPWVDEVR